MFVGDYSSIQDAINIALDGDTVLVGKGTYYENLIIQDKNVSLKSEEGRDSTIIDLGWVWNLGSYRFNINCHGEVQRL